MTDGTPRNPGRSLLASLAQSPVFVPDINQAPRLRRFALRRFFLGSISVKWILWPQASGTASDVTCDVCHWCSWVGFGLVTLVKLAAGDACAVISCSLPACFLGNEGVWVGVSDVVVGDP
jgi:hypothetical protein